MDIIHGELPEINAVLATPHLEVVQFVDGWLLRGQHQYNVLFLVFSHHHGHVGVGSET